MRWRAARQSEKFGRQSVPRMSLESVQSLLVLFIGF
jgi:hypothetical protein